MATIINGSRRIRFYAAVLAVAALAITFLAVAYSTGPAQAQSETNDYAEPRPCGPGSNTDVAFQPEPHEITSGQYALFDAYWEWTRLDDPNNPDDTNEGIIHTNECPPKMVETTEYDDVLEKDVVTISRAVSHIDTAEVIVHVEDTRHATVVDSRDPNHNPGAVEGLTIDLRDYPEVGKAASVGDKIWWLRLDDLDTPDVNEASDMIIGFSTALFEEKYWLKKGEAGGAPMRYMLETARYREGDRAEAPHFFAYEAPKVRRADDGARSKPVLDSANLDVERHNMDMDPGEYRALEWIFTKKGSYTLQAHLQGFVRHSEPSDAGDDWAPISSNGDETSEVKKYVFQVGELDETEPPMFGVNVSVHEGADAGTNVGNPIQVFGAEVPNLTYSLAGDGSANFRVIPRTDPHNAAQLVVADNAKLDYDIDRSYDLVVGVSDNTDHEGNRDPSVDHTVAVEVDVVRDTRVFATVSSHSRKIGESVTIKVNLWAQPDGIENANLAYTLWETASNGEASIIYLVPSSGSQLAMTTERQDSPGTYKYTPTATYTLDGVTYTLHGDPVTVHWRR